MFESPRCGSGPNCPLEGPAHSPIAAGGPFRSSRSPSLPTLWPPSSPTPLALFAMLRDGAAQRRPMAQGGGGEGPPSGTWGQTHIRGYSLCLAGSPCRSSSWTLSLKSCRFGCAEPLEFWAEIFCLTFGCRTCPERQRWSSQKCSRKECLSKRTHQNEQTEGGIFLEQPFGLCSAASW